MEHIKGLVPKRKLWQPGFRSVLEASRALMMSRLGEALSLLEQQGFGLPGRNPFHRNGCQEGSVRAAAGRVADDDVTAQSISSRLRKQTVWLPSKKRLGKSRGLS